MEKKKQKPKNENIIASKYFQQHHFKSQYYQSNELTYVPEKVLMTACLEET